MNATKQDRQHKVIYQPDGYEYHLIEGKDRAIPNEKKRYFSQPNFMSLGNWALQACKKMSNYKRKKYLS